MRTKHPSWRWFAFFNNDEDDGPPGSGGGSGGNAEDRRQAGLTALKARHSGDLERAVTVLFDENYKLRERNRVLKEKADAATLPEGASVLTQEELAVLEAYRKLGAPDDLVPKSELDKVTSELNQVSRERLAATAASTYGYDPSVLSDLVRDKALHLEVKDETVDGKPKKVFYTRPLNDAEAKLVPLDKHVTESLAAYLPALKVKQGVTFPGQGSAAEGSNGAGTSVVDRHIAERAKRMAARPNPLAPQPTGE
jgi:hypothetical protein